MRILSNTIATDVEYRALAMLADLLKLDNHTWIGFFTPGSSTSNLYDIACGREHVLRARGAPSPSAEGIQAASEAAGVCRVQVLCSTGHPSIMKAASLACLGRGAVKQMGLAGLPWYLDVAQVRKEHEKSDCASIVSVSVGEVNTGKFGVSAEELQQFRKLCDRHKARLHIDAGLSL